MAYRGVFWSEYVSGVIPIGNIPYKHWTKDIIVYALTNEPFAYYDALFAYTLEGQTGYNVLECFNLIPVKYRSAKTYKKLLLYDFINYAKYVPYEYNDKIKLSDEECQLILDTFSSVSDQDKMILLYQTLARYVSIRYIPYEYWNEAIVNWALRREPYVYYNLLLEYTMAGKTEYSVLGCFNLIPALYRNVSVYQKLLNYDFITYIKYVPSGYLDMVMDIGKDTILANFKYLPASFRTPELYKVLSSYDFNEYLMNVVNFHGISVEYLNKDTFLREFYQNLDMYVKQIPVQYRSKELCEMLTEKDFNKYFAYVPEEYRTSLMYEQFVLLDPFNNINLVPLLKRNQKMYDAYFDVLYSMYDSFDDDFVSKFESIPEIFRSSLIYQKLMLLDTRFRDIYFNNLPSDNFDHRFVVDLLENDFDCFSIIPDKLKSDRVFIDLIKKDINKYLPYLPKKYYVDEVLAQIKDIIMGMPSGKKITTDSGIVDVLITKYPELLSKFGDRIIKRVLEDELYGIINSENSISDLKVKYKITDDIIRDVLDIVKQDNVASFTELDGIIFDEKMEYCNNITDNIVAMDKIISSLGRVTRKTLTTSVKVKIAYLVEKYIEYPLEELYSVNSDKGYSKTFNSFIENVLDYGSYSREHNILVKAYGIKYSNPWLKQFDFNKYFDIRDGVAHSVYKFGKNEVELTMDIARNIINTLIENDIPLNYLIVVLAFRNYFNGSLSEYIRELHSYDMVLENVKKRKKVRD